LDFVSNTCFPLAFEDGKKGGTYPAVLCSSDEDSVHAFLRGQIGFGAISGLLTEVLGSHQSSGEVSIDSILNADEWARDQARKYIDRLR
ncbi:MAG: 1-deoxy-D-xylulose-5-phosphate reductoisomerase, partial [Gammaproteobacteria bacterium]|nr:1-deoxy-D-xylulose-5-phosphate reductoisomerase [Gammaproteobacteria bacterium]